MTLYFITSSKGKFFEAKKILRDSENLEQLDIGLPEIQEIDPRKIVIAKLKEALKHKKEDFIVEDTSLAIKGANGLPGPLVKWFCKTIGVEGIYEMSKLFGEEAEARSVIGYADSSGQTCLFEGKIAGKIVKPGEKTGFSWDTIFVPEGSAKSFAEMSAEEKNKVSHRKRAFSQLKEHLEM